LLFVVIAILIALLSACSGPEATTVRASTPPASAAPAEPQAQEITVTGPIIVENQVDVVAQKDGVVASIRKEVGDRVRKGEVLAMLDDRQLSAEREAVLANLRATEANSKNWGAEARVAEVDLERAEKMFNSDLLTKQDLDHARFKLEAARYQADRERENLKHYQANLRVLDFDREKMRIVAPFEGVVARRYIRAGQRVSPNDRLFWVTATSPMRVRFTLPQEFVGKLKQGSAVAISAPSPQDAPHTARIKFISPVVDPSSGTIEVLAELTGPAGDLRPGMTATVHLPNPR
jgi:RND family efflux transporter MFP subunit